MDPQTAGAQALGTAELPRGPPLPYARKAFPSSGVSAALGPGAATTCGRVGKLQAPRSRGSASGPLEAAR